MKILFVLINPNNFILLDSLIKNNCHVDIIFPINIPMFNLIDQKIKNYQCVYKTSTPEELFVTVEKLIESNNYDLIFPTFGDRTFLEFANFNEKFQLKGLRSATAKKIQNKSEYYKIWNSLNIPCPKIYLEIPTLECLNEVPIDIKFPCIVKPSVGSSGLGIQIIENKNSLIDFFSDTDVEIHKYQERRNGKYKGMQYCSGRSNYIIQEYIPGDIISFIGHVYRNKSTIDFVFDIETESHPYPAETSLIYPSKYEKDLIVGAVSDCLDKFFKNIDFDNSAFMLDVIVYEGQIFLIDFAPRISVSHNILFYSGEKDYGYKLANKLIKGINFQTNIHSACMFKYLPFEKKKIESIKFDRYDLVEVIKLPDSPVQMIRNDLSVFNNGYVIVTGENKKDLDCKYRQILQSLEVVYQHDQ
jgi:hypothetical protein